MKPNKVSSFSPPDSSDLWRKFIDPAHWPEALKQFPEAPWKFYLMPAGQYAPEAWPGFKRAVRRVWMKAADNRNRRIEKLSVRDILEINALVLGKDCSQWRKALRNNQPIFNYRTAGEILRVYEKGSCFYRNEDGLTLRVDGFWPAEVKSLDFFACCRVLAGTSFDKDPKKWEKAMSRFKALLYPKVSRRYRKWQVYFLTRRKDLIKQLEALLDWYNTQASGLLTSQNSSDSHPRKVLELAVKMQRYMDILQFCADGSGRTSKLIQDYIFLRFGYQPPKPACYEAHKRVWENGTYLPYKKAVQMQLQGWSEIRLKDRRRH